MRAESELKAVLNAVRDVPAEELPAFIGQLESIKAAAWMRLSSPAPAMQRDELLSVEQTAERLGMSTDYLYRNHKTLPFTRRMGRKLLFSSMGIDNYINRGKR
jgi:predicted DNA-binding transcriptional regulator AlpA